MIKVTAPCKLILIGEYVVLEGAAALVSAVNRFAEVTIEASVKKMYSVYAPSINIDEHRVPR